MIIITEAASAFGLLLSCVSTIHFMFWPNLGIRVVFSLISLKHHCIRIVPSYMWLEQTVPPSLYIHSGIDREITLMVKQNAQRYF